MIFKIIILIILIMSLVLGSLMTSKSYDINYREKGWIYNNRDISKVLGPALLSVVIICLIILVIYTVKDFKNNNVINFSFGFKFY